MLAYPDVQKRAQIELDAVVGRARVPTFADMPRLPYVCAMVKEVVRWRPPTPIAMYVSTLRSDPSTDERDPVDRTVAPKTTSMKGSSFPRALLSLLTFGR